MIILLNELNFIRIKGYNDLILDYLFLLIEREDKWLYLKIKCNWCIVKVFLLRK